MRTRLWILTTIVGIFFALQGILWIADPARAAASLGMPLLDGLARSTQIGDLGAFFMMAGATILLGSRPGWSRLLYVPAGLIACAAVMRTLAYLLHGAELASTFIAVEVVTSILLLAAARRSEATR